MNHSRNDESGPWTRYWDEKELYWYWFNKDTHESRWDLEDASSSPPSLEQRLIFAKGGHEGVESISGSGEIHLSRMAAILTSSEEEGENDAFGEVSNKLYDKSSRRPKTGLTLKNAGAVMRMAAVLSEEAGSDEDADEGELMYRPARQRRKYAQVVSETSFDLRW